MILNQKQTILPLKQKSHRQSQTLEQIMKKATQIIKTTKNYNFHKYDLHDILHPLDSIITTADSIQKNSLNSIRERNEESYKISAFNPELTH